jgi:nucleotide-binding universal stress UspA family protein
MSTKFLVPLDGSPRSESVFPWLRLLASASTPPVQTELIRCFQPVSSVYFLPDLDVAPSSYLSVETLEQMMLDYLKKKASELDGLQVSVSAVLNDAANGILEKAKTADLVVLATQGAGGLSRWLLGSVASRVAHGSAGPTLIVTARAVERPAKIEQIVVAVDGSQAAERAAAKAKDLAHQLQARLCLYQAVGQIEELHRVIAENNRQQLERAEAYMKSLAQTLEGVEGLETEVRGVRGDTEIVKVAEEKGADLLVMGSRGKGGLERALLGSQTERALRYSPCPVLIVP